MRPPARKPHGRHFAGQQPPVQRPVRGHLDPPGGPLPGPHGDIDIDATDAWEDVGPRARATRSRIAFAVSVTLAALPVLVLDNFPATADTGDDRRSAEIADEEEDAPIEVRASDGPISVEVDLTEPLHGTIDLEAPATLVTVAPPTVFVETPLTTVTLPAPTTTAPAPTTTAPKRAAATTTTTTKAPTTTAPARVVVAADPADAGTWEALAKCESGGNWAANTGNGYYGGLQFSLTTWQGLGGTGYPHEASKATQIDMGKRLQARAGWAAWPGCARKLGWS